MQDFHIPVPESLQSYVKDIVVRENCASHIIDIMPFYADGYPGILFRESIVSPTLCPGNKPLSELFLYGQTIKPIEIHFQAPYKVIVFELQPFVVRMIFGVNPKELNDDCYNFLADESLDEGNLISALILAKETEKQVDLISAFLLRQIQKQSATANQKTKLALDLVVASKGNISIKRLADQIQLSERTLQRLFKEHVGVSPKQFAKIIQFQSSLKGITQCGLQKLTDVVYEHGYADQSHFIRDFKKYTSTKPSRLRKKH
jgi:AraC-like DNA-binding protein